MKDAILCIDIGTSSLKAAYMADSPKSVAYSRYRFTQKDSSRAASEWMTAVAAVLRELKEKSPETGIEAVCVSGNGPTIVSDSGKTLMWWEDVCSSVKDEKSIFLPRIDGFRKKYPHEWRESARVFSGPEYLLYELTGAAVTILPEKRYGEYYWTQSQLKDEGFSEDEVKKLPPFVAPGSLAGKITADAAVKTGLLEGTLVFCGAPDFIAALLGTDTLEAGRLCDRSGSSEGLNLCTPMPLSAPDIRVLPSVIPGMWNASVLIPDTGKRFADFKEKVELQLSQKITHRQLTDEIIKFGSLENSLLSKELRDEGMTVIHDAVHQIWAAFNILSDACRASSIPVPESMTVTGGQALNETWSQVKCDTLGIPVSVTECVDAELVGDNILARTALGYYDSLEEAAFCLVKMAKTYQPKIPADK